MEESCPSSGDQVPMVSGPVLWTHGCVGHGCSVDPWLRWPKEEDAPDRLYAL